MSDKETRMLEDAGVQLRERDGKPTIEGYAAVFERLSEDLGGFREKIKADAFEGGLDGDVRALSNHSVHHVLGRTKSGTLELFTDARGLGYRITPPNAQWARDLQETLRRGDVDGSSFGFRVPKGGDSWDHSTTPPTRTVKRAVVVDVGPVTFPAYVDTEAALRSLEAARKRSGGQGGGSTNEPETRNAARLARERAVAAELGLDGESE